MSPRAAEATVETITVTSHVETPAEQQARAARLTRRARIALHNLEWLLAVAPDAVPGVRALLDDFATDLDERTRRAAAAMEQEIERNVRQQPARYAPHAARLSEVLTRCHRLAHPAPHRVAAFEAPDGTVHVVQLLDRDTRAAGVRALHAQDADGWLAALHAGIPTLPAEQLRALSNAERHWLWDACAFGRVAPPSSSPSTRTPA